MKIQKATGLVLYSRHSGEADVHARVFTREFGKRNFVFKGIKKSISRPQSAAEPGTLLELLYYFHDNREYHIVNEFKIVRHCMEIRSNLAKILHLFFICELVDRTTGINDPNAAIYSLAAAALDALQVTKNEAALSSFFALHLLRLLGILPDFSKCTRCGKTAGGSLHINTRDFSAVCSSCAQQGAAGWIIIKETANNFLQISRRRKFSDIDLSQFPESDITGLLFFLALFMENYFHCEIKSKGMLFNTK